MTNGFGDRWNGLPVSLDGQSPFGRTADKEDYRVFQLESISNKKLRGYDFSSSNLQHLKVLNCEFENCIFDGSSFVQFSCRETVFRNCSFSKADLRMAQIGYGWSIFDHCLFMKVRTTRIGFHNPIFDSVIFQGEEWQRVDFNAGGFWNCTFKGQMNDVMFRGDYRFPMQRQINGAPTRTGLHNVSFAEAKLLAVGFSNNCRLEGLQLPVNGDAFLCKTAVLAGSEQKFQSKLAPTQFDCWENYFRTIRPFFPGQEDWIVSNDDIVRFCGGDSGVVYHTLRECCIPSVA